MREKSDELEKTDQALSPEETKRILKGFRRLLKEQQALRKWLRLSKGNEDSEKIQPNFTVREPSRPVGIFSRLSDGRILWLRPDKPLIWDGRGWASAKGIGPASALEARLLTEEEIQDLISKGIFKD